MDEPTDVLSFPIDGAGRGRGPARARRRRDLPRAHRRPGRGGRPRRAAPLRLRPRDRRRRDARAAGRDRDGASVTRSGFVGLAGRPNVGKSTLVNAIVGAKVAIISDRPQTTRRAVRGIATDVAAGWQMVLVDLPGVQRPRDSLTQRMQRRVERELGGRRLRPVRRQRRAGGRPGRPLHRRDAARARASGGPVICAVNKCDRLDTAEDRRGADRRSRAGDRRRGLPGQRPDRGRAWSRWSSGWPS